MNHSALRTVATELGESAEQPMRQLELLIEALGHERVLRLIVETDEVERAGGMMLPDGSRRRTRGGVFFTLARRALPPDARRRIFDVRRTTESPPPPQAAPELPERPKRRIVHLPSAAARREPEPSVAPSPPPGSAPPPQSGWAPAEPAPAPAHAPAPAAVPAVTSDANARPLVRLTPEQRKKQLGWVSFGRDEPANERLPEPSRPLPAPARVPDASPAPAETAEASPARARASEPVRRATRKRTLPAPAHLEERPVEDALALGGEGTLLDDVSDEVTVAVADMLGLAPAEIAEVVFGRTDIETRRQVEELLTGLGDRGRVLALRIALAALRQRALPW